MPGPPTKVVARVESFSSWSGPPPPSRSAVVGPVRELSRRTLSAPSAVLMLTVVTPAAGQVSVSAGFTVCETVQSEDASIPVSTVTGEPDFVPVSSTTMFGPTLETVTALSSLGPASYTSVLAGDRPPDPAHAVV